MVHFAETMFDAFVAADPVGNIRGSQGRFLATGNVRAVVVQESMDGVGSTGSHRAWKIHRILFYLFPMQIGLPGLAGAVNADKVLQSDFLRANLRDVHMEVAGGILLELLFLYLLELHHQNPADFTALMATI